MIFHFIFTVYFYFVPIFRSEIESNPISRSYIVSSAKIMVTALKRAKKSFKNLTFLFIFTVFYIFSGLKLNQTLYLGLILFPPQSLW